MNPQQLSSHQALPPSFARVVTESLGTRLGHAVEYGLIFHGTHTGKYYCKNMKYRINTRTRKMVPIMGRASASFSSMLKLKRIGNE